MRNEMSARECLAWGWALFAAFVCAALLAGCTTAHFSRSITKFDSLGRATETTDVDGIYKSNKLFKADNVEFLYNPVTGEIRLRAAGMSNDPTAVIDAYGAAAANIAREVVEGALKAQGSP